MGMDGKQRSRNIKGIPGEGTAVGDRQARSQVGCGARLSSGGLGSEKWLDRSLGLWMPG